MAEPLRHRKRKRRQQICSAYSHRATSRLYQITEIGSRRDVRLSSNSGGIADIPALRVCATNSDIAA